MRSFKTTSAAAGNHQGSEDVTWSSAFQGIGIGRTSMERSVILCTGETFSIDEEWLSNQVLLRTDGSSPLPVALQDQEKEMTEAALAKSRGEVAGPHGAAAKLGIPASTVESTINQLGIEKRRFTSAS
jgi:transcriptional regulator with GAF, ATPase, and Fis domain